MVEATRRCGDLFRSNDVTISPRWTTTPNTDRPAGIGLLRIHYKRSSMSVFRGRSSTAYSTGQRPRNHLWPLWRHRATNLTPSKTKRPWLGMAMPSCSLSWLRLHDKMWSERAFEFAHESHLVTMKRVPCARTDMACIPGSGVYAISRFFDLAAAGVGHWAKVVAI